MKRLPRAVAAASLGSLLLLAGCSDSSDNPNNPNLPDNPEPPTEPEPEPTGQPLDVTILHINDHHSHIPAERFDLDVSGLGLSATTETGEPLGEVEVTYGGFPMMVTLFNQLATDSEHVLKLHAGDAITGTLYYSLFNGSADADVMNQICFDAFALGNHEFDDGDSGLATFLDELAGGACDTPTPVLAANVVPGDSSPIREGYIEPYTIVERGGEQVGIIGIDIAGKTKNSSQPDEGTQFLDETETAQRYIDELRDRGVNKIVLLTHYGYQNDVAMAGALNGVDVIVGGDSHSLLGDDTFSDLGFNPIGEYPTQVTDAGGSPVCVVQAWEYTHLMGKLDVSFDAEGRVTACAGSPMMPVADQFNYAYNDDETRALDAGDAMAVANRLAAEDEIAVTAADSATSALIAGFDEEVSVLEQTVIGTVAEDLCLERFPNQGRSTLCDISATYNRGSDISNIVAKAFMSVTPTADIGIQNGGGVRVDVAAGDFTIADAFTLLPFSNTLVTLEMTGQEIIDVLEDALANALDEGGSSGSYPYASGLRYHVDASQAFGARVSNVDVNPRIAGSWAPIDTGMVYTVVTNDFIASGRDGYDTFGPIFDAGNYVDTFTEYAQGFIDYVEAQTELGVPLGKLPQDEYSTQSYTGSDGCDHNTATDCEGF